MEIGELSFISSLVLGRVPTKKKQPSHAIIMMGPGLEPQPRTAPYRLLEDNKWVSKSAPFKFGDPRAYVIKRPGKKDLNISYRAVIEFIKSKYGLKDIDDDTPVVSVDSRADVERALKKSGPGGSKVFFGHAAVTGDLTDPDTVPTGLHLANKEEMTGAEFGAAIDAAGGGDPVFAICMGGLLQVPTQEKPNGVALGPKDAVWIITDVDFDSTTADKMVKASGALGPEAVSSVKFSFKPIPRQKRPATEEPPH